MTGVKRTRKSFRVASRYLAAVDGHHGPSQTRSTSPTIPEDKNTTPSSNPTTPKRNRHSLSTSRDGSLSSAKTPPHSCSKTTTTQTTIDTTPTQSSYRRGSPRTPTRNSGWSSQVRSFFPAAAVVSQQNTDGDDTDGSSLTEASPDNKKAAQESSELSSIGTNSRLSTPDLEVEEESNKEKISDNMRLMEQNLRQALTGKEGTRRSGSSKRPGLHDQNQRSRSSETGEAGTLPNQQQSMRQIPTISQASWIKKKKAERTLVYQMNHFLGTSPSKQTSEAYQVSECGAPTEIMSNIQNMKKTADTRSDSVGAPTEIMTNREKDRNQNIVDEDENDFNEFQSGQVVSAPQHQWYADDSVTSSRRASPGLAGRGKSHTRSSDTIDSEGGQIDSERVGVIGRSKSETPTSEIVNSDSGQIYSEPFSAIRSIGRVRSETSTPEIAGSNVGQIYSEHIVPSSSRYGQAHPKSDSSQISSGVFSGLESGPGFEHKIVLSPNSQSSGFPIGRLGTHVNGRNIMISPISKRSDASFQDRSITSSIGVEINHDSVTKPSWTSRMNKSALPNVHDIEEENPVLPNKSENMPVTNTTKPFIASPSSPKSQIRLPPPLPDFHQKSVSTSSPGRTLLTVSSSPFLIRDSQNVTKPTQDIDSSKIDSNVSPTSSGWTPASLSESAIEPESVATATPETIRIKGENKNASRIQQSNPFNTINNLEKQELSHWRSTSSFMASHAQVHKQQDVSSLKKTTETAIDGISRDVGYAVAQNEKVSQTTHATLSKAASSSPAQTPGRCSVKDRIRAFSTPRNEVTNTVTPDHQGAKSSSGAFTPKLPSGSRDCKNDATNSKRKNPSIDFQEAVSVPTEQGRVEVIDSGKFEKPVETISGLKRGGASSVAGSFLTAVTSSRMVSSPRVAQYEQGGSRAFEHVKRYSIPLKESNNRSNRGQQGDASNQGGNDDDDANADVQSIRSFFEKQKEDENVIDEDDQSLDVQSIRSIFEEGNKAPIPKESEAFRKNRSMFETPQKEEPRGFSGNAGVKNIWAKFEAEKKREAAHSKIIRNSARASPAPPSGDGSEKRGTEKHSLSSGMKDEMKSRLEHPEETEPKEISATASPHRMSVLDRARLFNGGNSKQQIRQATSIGPIQQGSRTSHKTVSSLKGSQNITKFPQSGASTKNSSEWSSHSKSSAATRGAPQHVSVTDSLKDATNFENNTTRRQRGQQKQMLESRDIEQSSNVQECKPVHVPEVSEPKRNISVQDRIKALTAKPSVAVTRQFPITSTHSSTEGASEPPDSLTLTEGTEPGAIGISPRIEEQTNIESPSFAKVQVGSKLESPRKLKAKLVQATPATETPTPIKRSITATNVVRNTRPLPRSNPNLVSPQRSTGSGSRSNSDFDDGVTLELSIAEISALTNPTCLQSKEEFASSTSSQVSSEHTSKDERVARRSEASSSQMSEAAAPLIARMQFSRLNDNFASVTSSSSPRRSNARTPSPAFQKASWDTTRIISPSKFEKSSSPVANDRQKQQDSTREEEKVQKSDFEEAFDAPLSNWNNTFSSNNNSWFEWIPSATDDFFSLEGANAALKDNNCDQKQNNGEAKSGNHTQRFSSQRLSPKNKYISPATKDSHSPRRTFNQSSSQPSTPVSELKPASLHSSYTSTETPVRSNTAAQQKEATKSSPGAAGAFEGVDSWSSTRAAMISRLRTLKAARMERRASRSRSADGQRRQYRDRSSGISPSKQNIIRSYTSDGAAGSSFSSMYGVEAAASSTVIKNERQHSHYHHNLRDRLEDPRNRHNDINIPLDDDFSLSTKGSTRFGGQNFEHCLELD